ncbi:MAG TPA: LPS export ABC transporter permease LptG, partial [Gammaproteobacteria bacterium]|nr:LPS export ABC transporter permease LptG [Gammaproteobacteria bacterium]
MKILDRYIGWSVAGSMLTVLFVLLALFSFGTFVAELDQTGRGDYTPLKAAQYVLLTLPRLAYQLFPMVALLGAILGLGVLASHNELTVMRAAGVATGRIVWAVMKVGLVLMVLAAALGEYLAPPAEDYARSLRAKALSQQVALTGTGGLWARDGRQYVHVRDVLAGGELGGVTIYRFAEDLRLVEVIRARRARYGELAWLLQDVSRNRISEEQVSSARLAQLVWPTVVTPELIGVVAVKPDSLSAAGLWR